MQRQNVSIIELDRLEAVLMKDKYFIIESQISIAYACSYN